MDADTNGLLHVDRVTKRFGDRLVLDEVSLSVGAGETVALIGPSGGGKSTLLRCINGLVPFDSGRVRVGPHELGPRTSRSAPDRRAMLGIASRPAGWWMPRGGGDAAPAAGIRRLVGMVFQDFQLFPHFTALENIIEAPVQVLGVDRQAAVEQGRALLERVGLADRADAYPQQLSGGQKQRVAIARALAMEPRALLCDEITSALDPELKNEVLSVLEQLKRDGITLLLVTHEIGFARRAADRVVVLADGKIIEDGPPQRVIEEPQVPRTRQFLSRVLA